MPAIQTFPDIYLDAQALRNLLQELFGNGNFRMQVCAEFANQGDMSDVMQYRANGWAIQAPRRLTNVFHLPLAFSFASNNSP
jgi:hypothetical protein